MTFPIFQVDAFSECPFGGNPAAVCLHDGTRDARWMQSLASEMNLAETAFLARADEGWSLRWFTPRVEVDLCGHATLASAHVLRERGDAGDDETIAFDTRSGRLTARCEGERIWLDFPARPATECGPPPRLIESLGARPSFVARNRDDWLLAVDSADELHAIEPDFRALARVEARGVIVTAPSDRESADFVSRFFAPASGIDEDSVTGSAHCCLAPHWAARLGRDELTGYQASERGGHVLLRVRGSRVELGGQATTIFRGELAC